MPVHDGLAGLAGVSLTCSARAVLLLQSRKSNNKKSNPCTKPPSGTIRGKLIGFKVAGCLDQPHCLAVVTKGWQVPQCWRRTEYTRRCDGQWITRRSNPIFLTSSQSPAKCLPPTPSNTSARYLFPSIRLILKYLQERALLALPVVSVHLEL